MSKYLKDFISENTNASTNNYLMACEKWRKIFLSMDMDELIERFHLEHDNEALYITYYNEKYRLDRKTGMVVLADKPDFLLSFNTAMSIYNLFYYSKPDAKVRGEFVPFRLVKRAAPFDPAYQKTTIKPFARAFSGHCKELKDACIALGGKSVPQGDVGYVINAFDFMPVTVLFWDGDDEFEAQANILFDADITDFLHEETVCCIASDLVRRLAEEANIGEIYELLAP
ncbi:MAG: DUF3786 domain-containing protein [Clostridia bacterium]|nr:DUF3786 domain-containing protein [Clostridia bacterium]NCC42818.1 DUF3786 domain-containing protein [Clostridia bacterium]